MTTDGSRRDRAGVAPTVARGLATWRHGRRYLTPPAMITAATQRRLAGDWRGACAAARVDARVDLDAVRDAHGGDLADRVADDLAHLAPDLARWHLPLAPSGGFGRFQPGLAVELAAYGPALSLQLRTPVHLERPQRPRLVLGALPQDRRGIDSWTTARDLWDVRASDRLLDRLAAGGDRLPFHTRDGRRLADDELPDDTPGDGDPVRLTEWVMRLQDLGLLNEAWEEAGVDGSLELPTLTRGMARWQRLPYVYPERHGMVVALVRRLRTLEPADGYLLQPVGGRTYRPKDLVVSTTGERIRLRLVSQEERREEGLTFRHDVPRVWWQRFPDLELLRLGMLTPPELHPLVRASLFPQRPGTADDEAPPAARLPEPVRVRCRGEWHRVGWRDGHADTLDHEPDEAQRERALRALGGEVPGCFAVTQAWQATAGRLPRALRDQRRHALSLILAGDRDAFVALLDDGLDPRGIRDRRGRDPLHLIAHLDDATLVPRLVAAGLDPNRPSGVTRTPLLDALFDEGSAAVVRALLDAGADVTAVDDRTGSGALQLLRSTDAAQIVPWLVAGGLDVNSPGEDSRQPLASAGVSEAPPEVFAALLAAGADPHAVAEYDDRNVADFIRHRDDLAFVKALVRPLQDPWDDE